MKPDEASVYDELREKALTYDSEGNVVTGAD